MSLARQYGMSGVVSKEDRNEALKAPDEKISKAPKTKAKPVKSPFKEEVVAAKWTTDPGFVMPAPAKEAKPVGRPSSGKVVTTIRLDPEIITALKAQGDGWQARCNDLLRKALSL